LSGTRKGEGEIVNLLTTDPLLRPGGLGDAMRRNRISRISGACCLRGALTGQYGVTGA